MGIQMLLLFLQASKVALVVGPAAAVAVADAGLAFGLAPQLER